MSHFDDKVVGFFAYRSPTEIVCTTGAACVITASEETMRQHLFELDPAAVGRHTIKKTRFGEVFRGLRLGGAYAFDRESYARFYPLALTAGLAVSPAGLEADQFRRDRFFTVQLAAE